MIAHCNVEYIAKWFCKDTEQFNDIFLCKIELIKKTIHKYDNTPKIIYAEEYASDGRAIKRIRSHCNT